MPDSQSVLNVADNFGLPIDAVTATFAILAVTGAGKSNTAVVMAEEMYDAGLPWVAVDPKGDWWGVRSSGTGKSPGLSVVVFGGEHGDVPLEPTAGALVADLVVEHRLTCVLDISEMTKADQRRFLIAFAERLYRRNREPLHLFLEEADEYIPQKVMGETAKLVGAMETLVKRGRFRGIGCTMITQRSASLNKDVLTQIGTLIAMRTTSPQDRKAILAWIDYHATSKDVVDQLPTLDNGAAWLFSPQWLKTLTRIQFRQRRTFDSGATPAIGMKARTPTRLADIDLGAIKEAMAETIEKAQASDPQVLQRRIASLEVELRSLRAVQPEPEIREVEVSVFTKDNLELLEEISRTVNGFTNTVEKLRGDAIGKAVAAQSRTVAKSVSWTPVPPREPPKAVRSSPSHVGEGDRSLGKAEKAILTVLAVHGPRTPKQLPLQTGYSSKASTISVALSNLRKYGYVESGQPIRITEAGLRALGEYAPLPVGRDLLEYWRHYFSGTERNVLDVLMQYYPNEMSTEQIALAAGYSPSASTTSVALSKLRKVGVVTGRKIDDDFWRSVQ